jgi:hypothetical protein
MVCILTETLSPLRCKIRRHLFSTSIPVSVSPKRECEQSQVGIRLQINLEYAEIIQKKVINVLYTKQKKKVHLIKKN